MTARIRIQEAAARRLDDIYRYTAQQWDDAQAEAYITGMFEAFDAIETGAVLSRPIPAEYGVSGFFFRYERHFIYWRRLENGDIGIATILHEQMHQFERLRTDFSA